LPLLTSKDLRNCQAVVVLSKPSRQVDDDNRKGSMLFREGYHAPEFLPFIETQRQLETLTSAQETLEGELSSLEMMQQSLHQQIHTLDE
jgi:hypothetical protein